jgi:hypothetical protein
MSIMTVTEKFEREEIKNAIQFVSEHLEKNPAQSVQKLVNKAIFAYDLSPADAEFLMRFFHEREFRKAS